MGLFKKKTKEMKGGEIAPNSQPPALPKLPKLPEIPGIESKAFTQEATPKLPKYPSNSLGNKFSQDTIKEAVTGKKEAEIGKEDEFASFGEPQKIPKPIQKPVRSDFGPGPKEPVFIRIDKFEQSLDIFNRSKKQIDGIEDMLADIKKVREDEDKALDHWEKEIRSVKSQIEKIDKDIFSKVE